MKGFIEVFQSNDPRTTYYAIIWQSCTVVNIVQCAGLAEISAICAQHTLPVVCNKEGVRDALRAYGVKSYPFITKIVHRENHAAYSASRNSVENTIWPGYQLNSIS